MSINRYLHGESTHSDMAIYLGVYGAVVILLAWTKAIPGYFLVAALVFGLLASGAWYLFGPPSSGRPKSRPTPFSYSEWRVWFTVLLGLLFQIAYSPLMGLMTPIETKDQEMNPLIFVGVLLLLSTPTMASGVRLLSIAPPRILGLIIGTVTIISGVLLGGQVSLLLSTAAVISVCGASLFGRLRPGLSTLPDRTPLGLVQVLKHGAIAVTIFTLGTVLFVIYAVATQ